MTDRGDEPESGEREDGELRPEDVDRRFEELVKAFGETESKQPTGYEVEAEKPEPEPAPAPEPDEEPTLLELWDAELPEDEEDRYEPPEPPPLPWPSLPAIGGLLLIIGGIAMVVNPGLAPLGTNPGRLVGIVGFLIGVWLLINRLRPDRDADDTDDGAVV
ncbi:hypothetical protein [Glycomyces sp. NRRL B-16210]|uniref:hypothetical protein n=1 Tax=Glycomyces sp. NRRL B-16210 TaxID=1463821 RepID=UPI00068B9D8C|nr:hypothetical protein [Glycomyces sp. NRRL B-16210]